MAADTMCDQLPRVPATMPLSPWWTAPLTLGAKSNEPFHMLLLVRTFPNSSKKSNQHTMFAHVPQKEPSFPFLKQEHSQNYMWGCKMSLKALSPLAHGSPLSIQTPHSPTKKSNVLKCRNRQDTQRHRNFRLERTSWRNPSQFQRLLFSRL